MKLLAVTRIRNEDDIVEAFVRHHAALVDQHLFLDNASNDRTPDILTSLQREGLPLVLYGNASAALAEATQNTLLLRRAVALGADWVIHLDCDEFIDPRRLGGSLHEVLATLPPQAPCAGTIERNTGIHYTHVFENLRDHPEWLLQDSDFLEGARPVSFYTPPLVADAIDYLGGELRYTRAGDARLKAVRSIIAGAETVARQHGELADATEATRRMVDEWGAAFHPLP